MVCLYGILAYVGLQKLSFLRQEISTRFSVNFYKSIRCNEFFIPARRNVNTRSDALLILEEKCNTRRCYNAPNNFLVGLINKKKARILRSKKCLCNICSLGTNLSVTCGLLGQAPVSFLNNQFAHKMIAHCSTPLV